MVIECKLCDFIFTSLFSAGSSGLFATSPEEWDLFPTKPASQKKLVRAAIHLHTASNFAFFSPLPILFLSYPPSSLPLSYVPSSLPLSYLPSSFSPFLTLSLSFSHFVPLFPSSFSLLPFSLQPEVARKIKTSVNLTESTVTSPVVSPSASKLKVGEGGGERERRTRFTLQRPRLFGTKLTQWILLGEL